jgi:hypothetical protein
MQRGTSAGSELDRRCAALAESTLLAARLPNLATAIAIVAFRCNHVWLRKALKKMLPFPQLFFRKILGPCFTSGLLNLCFSLIKAFCLLNAHQMAFHLSFVPSFVQRPT